MGLHRIWVERIPQNCKDLIFLIKPFELLFFVHFKYTCELNNSSNCMENIVGEMRLACCVLQLYISQNFVSIQKMKFLFLLSLGSMIDPILHSNFFVQSSNYIFLVGIILTKLKQYLNNKKLQNKCIFRHFNCSLLWTTLLISNLNLSFKTQSFSRQLMNMIEYWCNTYIVSRPPIFLFRQK